MTKPSRTRRSRRWRTALVLALSAVAIISIVTVQFINANTVRLDIHIHLSANIYGNSYVIPANIGVNRSLWKAHSLDQFGVGGLSPIQTHDSSGVIEVRSNTVRNFTLHEFLDVWGQTVGSSIVLGTDVDGGFAYLLVNQKTRPITDDVVFVDGENILIVLSGQAQS